MARQSFIISHQGVNAFRSERIIMATIKDIADRVGISVAAVSRILNHKGSFSQETIRNVEQAARELGYVSPSMAKQEVIASCKTIAVILPYRHSPYYSVLCDLMEQAAYDYGYSLLLCSTLFNNDRAACLDLIRKQGVSGIVLGSYTYHHEDLKSAGLPIVTVGFRLSDDYSSVRSDNYAGGKIAARHLLGKGCRNLLYVTKYADGIEKDERWLGFESELRKADCEVHPYRILSNRAAGDNSEEMLTKIALEHPNADGLFAESQRLAMQCIRVFSGLGCRIPSDIRMIGYGNPYFVDYSCPMLTIIRENIQEVARKTISCLVDEIEQGSREKKDILIPVALDMRETT